MQSVDRPTKRQAFLSFLRDGWVSVHLDARNAGVVVPDALAEEPHLVLQYGHDLPVPIPDLDVGEEGITATLSFSRVPQKTVVPWSAVYVIACTDGRGVLYYEDVPEEVTLMFPPPSEGGTEDGSEGTGDAPFGVASATGKPGLAAVDADAPSPFATKGPKGPVLRELGGVGSEGSRGESPDKPNLRAVPEGEPFPGAAAWGGTTICRCPPRRPPASGRPCASSSNRSGPRGAPAVPTGRLG